MNSNRLEARLPRNSCIAASIFLMYLLLGNIVIIKKIERRKVEEPIRSEVCHTLSRLVIAEAGYLRTAY